MDQARRTCGFLEKKGHRVKNWKTRFFVLDGDQLTYYAKEGGAAGAGRQLTTSVVSLGLVNRAGRTVAPGTDAGHRHKFYCGVRKPTPGTNGQCGPSNGPQCDDCTAFQAALAFKGTICVVTFIDVPDRGGLKRGNRIDIFSSDGKLLSVAAPTPEDKASWLAALGAVAEARPLAQHPRSVLSRLHSGRRDAILCAPTGVGGRAGGAGERGCCASGGAERCKPRRLVLWCWGRYA
jgi:hypothetical protein